LLPTLLRDQGARPLRWCWVLGPDVCAAEGSAAGVCENDQVVLLVETDVEVVEALEWVDLVQGAVMVVR